MLLTFSLYILDCFSDIFRSIWFLARAPEFPTRGFNAEADRQSTMQSTVLSSWAVSITVVYPRASELHSWACPASPCHVALYLQHLIEESHSPCVVNSAVYGTKWAHTKVGIPSPTDNPIIEGVRCASKRILGLMRSP